MSSSPTENRAGESPGYVPVKEESPGRDDNESSKQDAREDEQKAVAPRPKKKTSKTGKGEKTKVARRKRPTWLDEPMQDEKQMAQNNWNMQQQAQQQQQVQQDDGGSKDTLKLRLDLNLEVDIELKARIHGDLTLQLLG